MRMRPHVVIPPIPEPLLPGVKTMTNDETPVPLHITPHLLMQLAEQGEETYLGEKEAGALRAWARELERQESERRQIAERDRTYVEELAKTYFVANRMTSELEWEHQNPRYQEDVRTGVRAILARQKEHPDTEDILIGERPYEEPKPQGSVGS